MAAWSPPAAPSFSRSSGLLAVPCGAMLTSEPTTNQALSANCRAAGVVHTSRIFWTAALAASGWLLWTLLGDLDDRRGRFDFQFLVRQAAAASSSAAEVRDVTQRGQGQFLFFGPRRQRQGFAQQLRGLCRPAAAGQRRHADQPRRASTLCGRLFAVRAIAGMSAIAPASGQSARPRRPRPAPPRRLRCAPPARLPASGRTGRGPRRASNALRSVRVRSRQGGQHARPPRRLVLAFAGRWPARPSRPPALARRLGRRQQLDQPGSAGDPPARPGRPSDSMRDRLVGILRGLQQQRHGRRRRCAPPGPEWPRPAARDSPRSRRAVSAASISPPRSSCRLCRAAACSSPCFRRRCPAAAGRSLRRRRGPAPPRPPSGRLRRHSWPPRARRAGHLVVDQVQQGRRGVRGQRRQAAQHGASSFGQPVSQTNLAAASAELGVIASFNAAGGQVGSLRLLGQQHAAQRAGLDHHVGRLGEHVAIDFRRLGRLLRGRQRSAHSSMAWKRYAFTAGGTLACCTAARASAAADLAQGVQGRFGDRCVRVAGQRRDAAATARAIAPRADRLQHARLANRRGPCPAPRAGPRRPSLRECSAAPSGRRSPDPCRQQAGQRGRRLLGARLAQLPAGPVLGVAGRLGGLEDLQQLVLDRRQLSRLWRRGSRPRSPSPPCGAGRICSRGLRHTGPPPVGQRRRMPARRPRATTAERSYQSPCGMRMRQAMRIAEIIRDATRWDIIRRWIFT